MLRIPTLALGILVGALAISTTPLLAADTPKELRASARENARWHARFEQPIAERDYFGYCLVASEGPNFTRYLKRACESGVKNKINAPSECTDEAITRQTLIEKRDCLATINPVIFHSKPPPTTTPPEFDQGISRLKKIREYWLEDMKKIGLNGEKLIAEERARLKN